jgi:hypothetical protein
LDIYCAILVVSFGVGVATVSTAVVRRWPDAAELGARQLHRWSVPQAEYAALDRGESLDLTIWEEFWKTVEKHEAKEHALGGIRESVFARFAAVSGVAGPPLKNQEVSPPIECRGKGDYAEKRTSNGYRLHSSTSANISHLYAVLMMTALLSYTQKHDWRKTR